MAPDQVRRAGWQPGEEDRLLLQALLLPGQAGHTAWCAWSARVALDDVGGAAYRLLPELYQVLLDGGVDTPDQARLKGISRKTWYENQLRLAALEGLILALASAGVETLLLRGAIPVGQASANRHPRNTSDMACAVPFDQAPIAFEALAGLGWRPAQSGAVPRRHWRYRAGMPFQSPAGEQTVELIWRLAPFHRAQTVEAGVWLRSRHICFAGQDTRMPDGTDQLWLACATSPVWQAEADWRWVLDAFRLIQDGGVDWSRLVDTSRECQAVCQVRAALSFMATVLQAPVPATVLAQLHAAAVSPAEAHLFQLTSRRQGRLGRARKHWLQYCVQTAGRPTPAGFLHHLEAEWGLGSNAQVLLEAFKRGTMRAQPARPV